jgi:hypothetical protein
MLTPRMGKALKTKRGSQLCLYLPNSGGQNLKSWEENLNPAIHSKLKVLFRLSKEVVEIRHQ